MSRNRQALGIHRSQLAELVPAQRRPAAKERRKPVVAKCSLLRQLAGRHRGEVFGQLPHAPSVPRVTRGKPVGCLHVPIRMAVRSRRRLEEQRRLGRLRTIPGGNGFTVAKGDIHVVPSEEGWRVEVAADGRARSVHRTQREAREAAREIARRNERKLFVHRRDGQIRERSTYGRDPRRTPG
jgi:hypothetical protein